MFVAFQVVQVVVPMLPGGLGCLVGVVLFGPVMGFVYNYVGICIGSLLAFAVAAQLRAAAVEPAVFGKAHRQVQRLDRAE